MEDVLGGGVCFVVVYSDCVMCCDAVNIVWLNRNVLRSRMFSVSLTGGSMVCMVIIVCYLYNLGTWAVKKKLLTVVVNKYITFECTFKLWFNHKSSVSN